MLKMRTCFQREGLNVQISKSCPHSASQTRPDPRVCTSLGHLATFKWGARGKVRIYHDLSSLTSILLSNMITTGTSKMCGLFCASCLYPHVIFFSFSKRKKIVLNITQCSGSFQSFITNTSADKCNTPFPAYICTYTQIYKHLNTHTHTHTHTHILPFNHFRHCDIICTATHCNGHV